MSTAIDSRFYYDRIATWLVRGFSLFVGLLGLIIAGAHTHPPLGLGIRAAIASAGIAWAAFTWLWVRRVGVEVRSDGIRIFGGVMGPRRVSWSEVRAFKATPRLLYPRVQVELASGLLVKTYLQQGRKVVWHHGSTTDILGMLNRELQLARGEA